MPESEVRKTQIGGDHYVSMGVQPWDIIDTWSHAQQIGFFRGNALKYVMRLGSKQGTSDVRNYLHGLTEDAKKAKHYLEKLIEVLNTYSKGE